MEFINKFKLFALFSLASCLLVLGFPGLALAQEEFYTDSKIEYKVNEDGTVLVTQKITLENIFSSLYASAYSLTLENISPENIRAYDSSRDLPLSVKNDGDKISLSINFPDAVVGKGKGREFSISFLERSFAARTGEVWEITIPRLATNSKYRSYTTVLSIPNSLGKEAYISPAPAKKTEADGRIIYTFNKESVEKTGVTAGFGDFQVFAFNLNYHLENPLARPAATEIAVPPDTATQKTFYELFNPKPVNVSVDADGNWLASYNLAARERLDIQVKGYVQIFAGVRPFYPSSKEVLALNLKPRDFWQSDDSRIQELAKSLKTPRAIYDYVTTKLTYDYDRVKPNVVRLGALGALENPANATCMEFTDLFIAIARAAGIPAREVNGYAYTENPKLEPLSLVADVLHAWPEYWDESRRAWIPVDPTWGSTTGGVDFFNKLDLRHFAFVIHGESATMPYPPGSYKLGSNPQKDVFVSFGQLPADRSNSLELTESENAVLSLVNKDFKVTVKNLGPYALYNVKPAVFFDNAIKSTDTVQVIPPFASYQFPIVIPFSFLSKNTPNLITVSVDGKTLLIQTNKNRNMIYQLVGLFGILVLGIFTILFKAGKIHPGKIVEKIKKTIKEG